MHERDKAGGADTTATVATARNEYGDTSPRMKSEPAGEDTTSPQDEIDYQTAQPPKIEEEEEEGEEETEESKDWLELPMLDKLDSMHLLTEWQFQNPYRLRQLMKDDDDMANWVRTSFVMRLSVG